MTSPASESWFPPCRADISTPPVLGAAAVQLFCLPHAGAGASAYRNWPALLVPEFDVIPVQLPGRESRHREPLSHSVFGLTAGLLQPLADRADETFALFGHSMGALLGYELADLEVCESYVHPDRPLLRVPVTALTGRSDPGVSVDSVHAWGSLTAASFHAAVFPGGHFYLYPQFDEVAATISARLDEPGRVPAHQMTI